MMLKKLLTAAFILVVSGCTDKLTPNALNGTFSGEFYYVPPTSSSSISAPASVSFSDHTYSSQRNTNYIPAGGSGTFEIQNEEILDFKDQNIWTANFDWGLILNGKYKYQVKGDSLILTRYREPCNSCKFAFTLYQYRLKRSN